MVQDEQKWIARAEDFYRRRARTLKARRWLPEELEEEFVSECMLIEVAERRSSTDSTLPGMEPDRIRITTRALTSVRRTVRSMPWSVRSRLENESAAQPSTGTTPNAVALEDSAEWRDVRFITSLMDVVCAMHWMVWLSRKRSKPKGSGYTVRALAAVVGVPRMRTAREISTLDDWFKLLWAQVGSGEVGRIREELDRAEQEEARHFVSAADGAPVAYTRSLLSLDIAMVIRWLLQSGILPDQRTAVDLVEKAVALGLIGEGGRYLVNLERQVFGLSRGGLRDLVEDLGSLATCRQRRVSWNDLSGLQTMVSRHLLWIAQIDRRDVQDPEGSMIFRSIDSIEELLAQHPLGLQYWGTAVAQNRTVSPALRRDL